MYADKDDIDFLDKYRWCVTRNERDRLISTRYKKYKRRFMGNMSETTEAEREKKKEMEKEFHDAFVILWEKIEQGRILVEDDDIVVVRGQQERVLEESLYEYLRGIIYNNLRECWHEPNGKLSEELMNDLIPDIQSNENFRKELLEIVFDCLRRLRNQCKDILHMFYYEKMSYEEIGKEMFISAENMKAKKYRCMTSIRKMAMDIYKKTKWEENL